LSIATLHNPYPMPLPEKEPITFKGAKPGDAEAVAISLTLTQKQVEAMFMRKEELKDSKSPLEIDFDNKKLIIGDMVTSFTMASEEGGYRELCRRTPTGIDPLKPITTWGIFVGKLNIERMNDEEVANNVRRITEAENLKRNERTIVRLETPPPILSKGKKSKTSAGASALAKKAMSNSRTSMVSEAVSSSSRVVSTSPSKAASASVAINSTTKLSSNSVSNSYDVKEAPKIDLDTPRSRAIHGLGANPMSPSEFRGLLSQMSRRSVDETTSQNLLQEIAEPSPKDPSKWQLKTNTWREVRPNEAPDLIAEDRQTLRRKGRIALQLSLNDPLWACFQTDLSDKGETSRNGSTSAPQKALSARPGKLVAGTIAKAKVPAKSKAIKQEDNAVETKAKKMTPSTADVKGKAKAEANFPATLPIPPSQPSKREEKQIVPSSNKPRAASVSVNKEPSPLPPPKARENSGNRKRKTIETTEDTSGIEEGELPVKEVKKRKVSNITETVRTESSSKQASNRASIGRDGKERARMSIKDEEVPVRLTKELSSTLPSRAHASSSRTSLNNKDTTFKKESRDSEVERLRDYEKKRSSTKRPRRAATPSWTSSEEGEEPPAKKKAATSSRHAPATTAPSSRTSTSGNAKSAPSSRMPPTNKPPVLPRSYTVPTDKDGIRREYQRRHPQYLSLKARLFAQYAKTEELIINLGDTDSISDTDLLGEEELDRLVAEYKSLEHHLEQLTVTHTKLNTAY